MVKSRRSGVVVLVSGGLDSAVLLAELARQRPVQPVYIRSGLHWESAERYWLRRYLGRVASPRLRPLVDLALPAGDVYGDHWSVSGRGTPGYAAAVDSNYLPGRNLLLLSKAAVFCARHQVRAVALAVLRDNPFSDARPEFFRQFAAVVRCALGSPFEILTPFRQLSKAAVIRRGAGLPLQLTFSCAHPAGRRHCGECTKCAERQRAFTLAGVDDPARHEARRPRTHDLDV